MDLVGFVFEDMDLEVCLDFLDVDFVDVIYIDVDFFVNIG